MNPIAPSCRSASPRRASRPFRAGATPRCRHAEVPCEGIGLNREYDRDAPPLDEVLRDDWRPAKPELTDTTCHVFKVEAGGRLTRLRSATSAATPWSAAQETRHIHGDYAGVATNQVERDEPGSVGLFLQGAQGDVNICLCPQARAGVAAGARRHRRPLRAGRAGRPGAGPPDGR